MQTFKKLPNSKPRMPAKMRCAALTSGKHPPVCAQRTLHKLFAAEELRNPRAGVGNQAFGQSGILEHALHGSRDLAAVIRNENSRGAVDNRLGKSAHAAG